MAESEVAVVNSALIKIAEDTIVSLTQAGKAARTASKQYPILRRALIRRYRWNFAIKRVALAKEATGPAFGFSNQFLLPVDCLRLIGLFDEDELQQNYTASRVPHKVEGRMILSDDEPLNIFYLADIVDTALFDPLFSESLAWLLAIDLSYALSTGRATRKDAVDGFTLSIKDAKRADAIEGSPEVIESSEWLDARNLDAPLRIGPVVFV